MIYLSALLLLIVAGVIHYTWTLDYVKRDRSHECLIGSIKKREGLLFDGCFDIYHVSHIILWFIVGLISPEYYGAAFLTGLAWELYEHVQFTKDGTCKAVICGRIEDIILNMAGYGLGSWIRDNINSKL